MTVACNCTIVQDKSMTILGNQMRVAGYHTPITGDPRTKYTSCLQISAKRPLLNVTTADAI